MDSSVRKNFSHTLKKRRTELGMTQEQLGEAVKYSGKSVSKWESGMSMPCIEILPQLALALRTDVNTLLRGESEPKYFLGIDGGATKTMFALADKNGKIIRTCRLGACNPVDLGIERTRKVIYEGINEICRGIPFYSICVFAGISGGITGTYKEEIHDFLSSFSFARCDNGSDAQSAEALGTSSGDGIAGIMGTGCILYAVKNGTRRRIGGYGYLFDDGGSGYDIGRACIKAALGDDDGSMPETMLTKLVHDKLGASPLECLSDIYKKGKTYIASFAPLVFDAYMSGDSQAKLILENSMRNLARQINAAAEYFDGKDVPVTVTLVGGLTAQADILLPMIEKALKDPSKINLKICSDEPICGALLLAGAPIKIK